jgi:hypothetical protein
VRIPVYGPYDPISAGLVLGARYEKLLFEQLPLDAVYVQAGTSAHDGDEGAPAGWWVGVLHDVHWRAASQGTCTRAHEEMCGREYTLLETRYGRVVTDLPSVDSLAGGG